jgi:prolyl-tRNA synthetase
MGKCSSLGNENSFVLRTAEFLMKGHAHATKVEAVESEKMMNVYADFAQNFMAIPVVKV